MKNSQLYLLIQSIFLVGLFLAQGLIATLFLTIFVIFFGIVAVIVGRQENRIERMNKIIDDYYKREMLRIRRRKRR